MKTQEFIIETSLIAQEADAMHSDHEVQMARSDCYNAAKYAIELHRMLKQLSEQQGLDGWVSEKITLANDYLRTVHEYLAHEMSHDDEEMMQFAEDAAGYALDKMLNETATGGASGAGSIATSMSGPAGKPGTGKPKKIANAHKAKKVAVGKGVY